MRTTSDSSPHSSPSLHSPSSTSGHQIGARPHHPALKNYTFSVDWRLPVFHLSLQMAFSCKRRKSKPYSSSTDLLSHLVFTGEYSALQGEVFPTNGALHLLRSPPFISFYSLPLLPNLSSAHLQTLIFTFYNNKKNITSTLRQLGCHPTSNTPLPGGSDLKNLPAMWETRVRFLGREDLLEKGMATHSSVLAWNIPWTEEPDGLQSMGLRRARHDWATNTACPHFVYSFSLCYPLTGFLSSGEISDMETDRSPPLSAVFHLFSWQHLR